eukprot:scaffold103102_cov63-Phaeocystis_antarctica.AAC.8
MNLAFGNARMSVGKRKSHGASPRAVHLLTALCSGESPEVGLPLKSAIDAMSNDANWPPRSFQAVLQAWKPRDSRASLSELDPVLYEPRLKTISLSLVATGWYSLSKSSTLVPSRRALQAVLLNASFRVFMKGQREKALSLPGGMSPAICPSAAGGGTPTCAAVNSIAATATLHHRGLTHRGTEQAAFYGHI